MAGRICSLTNLLIDESEFLRLSMVDLQRYARHISLPGVGRKGQEKISQCKVLVIGAGGLGSPVPDAVRQGPALAAYLGVLGCR